MSYYESNYYRNPGPVYGSQDLDEPVPGWGVLPNMAGGRRVGVGDVVLQAAPTTDRRLTNINDETRHAAGLPWWAWLLVAAGAGTAVAVAQNRGYLKKAGLPK